MFEELLKLVNENATEAVVNNPEVPNQYNSAVTEHVTHGIIDGLKSQAASGGLADVMKLIGGGSNNLAQNPVVQNITNNLSGSLSQKFGINSQSATSIVSGLLPDILSKFVNKTNDPNDSSFDIGSIFNHISNGKTGGIDIASIVKNVASGQGGIDLSNITNLFGEKNESANSGGGLFNTIKGLFGK